ncbi:dynamin family protein [Paenibacillus sp. JJ-223]|uniref:dynamin family protein n=1 Tax=Paenibacillus sp. JJ-223 TaxID=2905647 RepID=UPI001F3E8598|nr:dynamin family protein [Paenibacillus sp. JJ-223]
MATENYYKNRAENIARQLEEKEFRITVVGEFSAGKSTFLNALIGKDILPHARVETTATITYIRNVSASHPCVNTIAVHFADPNKQRVVLDLNENPEALKMYTTTMAELNVAQEISYVDVYVNFKSTDEKVVFIDTPGLNGVADGHRDMTMHEIKRAHASICLFHLRSLSHSNLELLRILQEHQHSFLFVLNFIDELKQSEGENVESKLHSFHKQLVEQLTDGNQSKGSTLRTFGVSSLQALAAKDEAIPRVYSSDRVDLTMEDRETLLQESLFQLFEDYLWNDVLNGEQKKIFETSLFISFQSLLRELSEDLDKTRVFTEVQLDGKEIREIERRLVQLEELSARNRDKLTHYMNSRHSGLEKLLKQKIREDTDLILQQMHKKVHMDDFEAFESSMENNQYGDMLNSKLRLLSSEYHYYVSSILEEIYQTSIQKAKEYAPLVEIRSQGTLVIQATQFDGSDYAYEKKLDQLTEKKIGYQLKTNEIVDEQAEVSKELQKIHHQVEKLDAGIRKVEKNRTAEQSRLGKEPEVRQYTETRYRTKERKKFSPFRIFGGSTYQESYSETVTDTLERDQWRRNKQEIQSKYAEQKDRLQQEKMEINLRRRQLQMKAVQFADLLSSLETKLQQIEEDIRRKQIEYDEILMKARQEYMRSEKRRLMEHISAYLKERAYFQLVDACKRNVEINMVSIRQQVQEFYDRSQGEARHRLITMLDSGKDEIKQRIAPIAALQNEVLRLSQAMSNMNSI